MDTVTKIFAGLSSSYASRAVHQQPSPVYMIYVILTDHQSWVPKMSNRPRPEYRLFVHWGYSANAIEVLGRGTPDTSVAEVEVYSPITCAYTKNYYDRIFIESNLKSNKLTRGSQMVALFHDLNHTTHNQPPVIKYLIFWRHVLPFQSPPRCFNSFTHVRGSLYL